MNYISVWTKQHASVVEELNQTGRYVAKKEYISKELDEHAYLVLESYDWLVKNSPNASQRPQDAEYPIWLSTIEKATMLPSEGMVILELYLDPSLISMINIAKWGTILNYSYIPTDTQDAERHRQLLQEYNTSDAKAYMSQFYPHIKREIIDSWSRLFDNSIMLGNDLAYGIIWELKKEWLRKIIR